MGSSDQAALGLQCRSCSSCQVFSPFHSLGVALHVCLPGESPQLSTIIMFPDPTSAWSCRDGATGSLLSTMISKSHKTFQTMVCRRRKKASKTVDLLFH